MSGSETEPGDRTIRTPRGAATLSRRHFSLTAAGAAAAWLAGLDARPAGARAPEAGHYPAKPITIIVPAPAGEMADTFGRAAAAHLQERLRQDVVIENRSRAGGNAGAQVAAGATPDGYTLALLHASLVQNSALYSQPGYDPVRDFAPLAVLGCAQLIMVGRADLPFGTLAGMLAHAKANRDRLNIGSRSALQPECLRLAAKVDLAVIPYKSAAQVLSDVSAGQIELGLVPYPAALPAIAEGRLRGLCTTALRRLPTAPDMTAVAELIPGFDLHNWYGIAAPAHTPPAVTALLRRELVGFAQSPAFKEWLAARRLEAAAHPADLARVVSAEVARAQQVVRELNLPLL